MTFPRDQPRPELTTQRVPGGRRSAVIVLVIAVVTVGTLIWKPWDMGAPAAPPVPTFPPVAAATASPGPSVSPPDTQPPHSIPAVPAVTPPPLGSVTWFTRPGDPLVTCIYVPAGRHQQKLKSMFVTGPSVAATADVSANDLRAVAWQAVIEVNNLQSVFSAEWRGAAESNPDRYIMHSHDQFTLNPMTVDVEPDPNQRNQVFRAVASIQMLGPDDSILLALRSVATSYAPPANATEGCPAYVSKGKGSN